MKLLYYEARKYFLRKSIMAVLGILMVLNGLFAYFQYRQAGTGFSDEMTKHVATEGQWHYWLELHRELDGGITEEKVQKITSDYKKYNALIKQGDYSTEYDPNTKTGYVFGDFSVLQSQFYEPMKYLVFYQGENDLLVQHAQENISFFKERGDDFEVSKNTYIVKNYRGRNPCLFYDTLGWKKLFEYDYSDVMVFIIMFLCIVPCFYVERKSEMEHIILTSKRGKFGYTYVKYLAFYFSAVILVILFSVYNYVIMDCLYGLSGWNMELFSLKEFQYTPLNLSVMGFYILLTVLKCIALCGIVTLFTLIARVFSNVITIFLVMLALVMIGLYGAGFIHSMNPGNLSAALISPFSLLQGAQMYKGLSGVNIAGYFVPWLYGYLAIQVLMQAGIQLLIWIYVRCFSKRRGA